MRTINNSSVFYAPDQVPANKDDLPAYFERELLKIQRTFELLASGFV